MRTAGRKNSLSDEQWSKMDKLISSTTLSNNQIASRLGVCRETVGIRARILGYKTVSFDLYTQETCREKVKNV